MRPETRSLETPVWLFGEATTESRLLPTFGRLSDLSQLSDLTQLSDLSSPGDCRRLPVGHLQMAAASQKALPGLLRSMFKAGKLRAGIFVERTRFLQPLSVDVMKRITKPRVTASAPLLAITLSGCIGDLPASEYPCLVATDGFAKYNEVWVFSPRGDKKRKARASADEAERRCAARMPGAQS